MGRLPFNARRDRPASDSAGPPRDARPLSVRALAGLIESSIRDGVPPRVLVEGEVSGFRERTHWYFDLKDADAVVSCVVFASAAAKLTRVADGERVLVRGRVEFYAKAGKVSLIANRVERLGQGEHDAALRRLVEEIRGLGWLDAERKRRPPAFPSRVAVVTSKTSAAVHDVLSTLRRRCPMLTVVIADAPVQGVGAPAALAQRIASLSAHAGSLGLDAMIVTRGGGSAEDLAAFNDRELARAIVESSIPVIAAIGHETDTTIAELVADVRAATPTQAAVMISPDASAVIEMLESHGSRLAFAASRSVSGRADALRSAANALGRVAGRPALERHSQRLREAGDRVGRAGLGSISDRQRMLDSLELRLRAARPDRLIAQRYARQSSRLAVASAGLHAAIRANLTAARRRAAASARELHAIGPAEVLRRGYSVTIDEHGKALRSVADAPLGMKIETRLADGTIRSVVGDRSEHAAAPRQPPRRPGRNQLDLFDVTE